MLTHLYIENFTIIEKLDLPWQSGMTVITGETGAGKSIILDALELVLGSRAENGLVRVGCDKCEIIATFDIGKNNSAIEWLKEHELDSGEECLLRRSIGRDGRSKCFINGQPVTLQLLKEIGNSLLNIHGQHEHQLLTHRDAQRELLDHFAGHFSLIDEVKRLYLEWRSIADQIEKCKSLLGDRDSRLEFLKYQIREFEELKFFPEELSQLENEFKLLSTSESRIENYQTLLQLLDNVPFSQLLTIANSLPEKNIATLLEEAEIQMSEARSEIENHLEKAEVDPERLQQIEKRLTKIHDLARKHRVKLEELPVLQNRIQDELEMLSEANDQLEALIKKQEEMVKRYEIVSQELSKSRQKSAKKMSKNIEEQVQKLGMPGGRFSIQLEKSQVLFNYYGQDKIEFLVSANPGLPLQSLTKVASGGELSRISLAIQVIAAEKQNLPTLIFDEVDVGIGGHTAAIVGQLLKKLSNNAQIICITHLPQVASMGHQHLEVNKTVQKNQTSTQIHYLSSEARIQEIARMLGGLKITEQTLSHAKEMMSLGV